MTVELLYQTWRSRMLGYFTRCVGCAEAEDLTQDLFVRYLSSLEKGSHIDQPHRWLWRTAHNLVADVYRDQAKRQLESNFADLEQAELPDRRAETAMDCIIEHDACRQAERCLGMLSIEQQEAIVLRCWNDWSHRQIAAAQGISAGAARARYRRAVQQLVEILNDQT